jgi:hypothetical protein
VVLCCTSLASAWVVGPRAVRPARVRGRYAVPLYKIFIQDFHEQDFQSLSPMSRAKSKRRPTLVSAASGDGEDFDLSAFGEEMQRRNAHGIGPARWPIGSGPTLSSAELRELVVAKWGKPYDTRIHRRRDGRQQLKFYLQVMWKHAEQQSFHMSESEYMDQLGAVADLISEWNLGDYVRKEIKETKQRPGIGIGRGAVSGAVCVSIPLMWEDAQGLLHPVDRSESEEEGAAMYDAPIASGDESPMSPDEE